MSKIVVDHGKVVAMIHGVEQLRAHANERGGAARSKIEPAKKLEPARLADVMKLGRGGGRR